MKHNLKKTKVVLKSIAIFVLLAACNIKSKVGDQPPPTKDKFPGKPRVQGPVVEGAWSSNCVVDYYQSKKWSLSFAGDTFTRTQEIFNDQYCKTSKEKKIESGSYIFSHTFPDGSFEINYAIDLGSGWTSYVDEKILFENNILYISNYVSGEAAPIVRNMPMMKDLTSPPPAPVPVTPTCQNYSGQYQINAELFKIEQKDCKEINWSYLPTYFNPEGRTIIYKMDGVERIYDGKSRIASFKDGHFKLEYQESNHLIIEVWSFQKVPCNLSNPSGEEFLTRDVWIDGKESSDHCAFYSK